MASKVIIMSPKPNNETLHVLTQTIDDTGAPVGAATSISVLDDGQSCSVDVDPHTVVSVLEQPRNTPAVAPAPVPRTAAASERVHVIGGEIEVPTSAGDTYQAA